METLSCQHGVSEGVEGSRARTPPHCAVICTDTYTRLSSSLTRAQRSFVQQLIMSHSYVSSGHSNYSMTGAEEVMEYKWMDEWMSRRMSVRRVDAGV